MIKVLCILISLEYLLVATLAGAKEEVVIGMFEGRVMEVNGVPSVFGGYKSYRLHYYRAMCTLDRVREGLDRLEREYKSSLPFDEETLRF